MLPTRLVSSKLGVINLSLFDVCGNTIVIFPLGVHLLGVYSFSSYLLFSL